MDASESETKDTPPVVGEVHYATAVFAGAGGLKVKCLSRVETRLAIVAEFAALASTLGLPPGMATVVLACAADGVRVKQGRSGRFLSPADKDARAIAKKEAPAVFAAFLAEAKGTGMRYPRRWAREKTAEVCWQQVRKLGGNPPSIKTIAKKWKF
jgi:hypothetical protein